MPPFCFEESAPVTHAMENKNGPDCFIFNSRKGIQRKMDELVFGTWFVFLAFLMLSCKIANIHWQPASDTAPTVSVRSRVWHSLKELNRVSSEQEREKRRKKYSFYEAPVGVLFPPILLEIKIRLTDSFCQFNFFFTLKETFGRQCAPVSRQGKESNGTVFLNFIYLFSDPGGQVRSEFETRRRGEKNEKVGVWVLNSSVLIKGQLNLSVKTYILEVLGAELW